MHKETRYIGSFTRTFLSKRKNYSLAFVLLFSLTIITVFGVFVRHSFNWKQDGMIFLITSTQISFFMWMGRMLFKRSFGTSQREITRNIVARFFLYYLLCLFSSAIIYLFFFLLFNVGDHSIYATLVLAIKNDSKTWLIWSNIGLLFGAILFFIIQWQHALGDMYKLKEENLLFRYQTLYNQVNPHFLFNSLNCLSSFISSKPIEAESYVLKLASTYRYILDHESIQRVSLDEELRFVKDYFYLHDSKERGRLSLLLDLEHTESIQVLPISLQILVENAIKHNRASTRKPLVIEIGVEGNYVFVRNNKNQKLTTQPSLGLGLKNLNNRYQLTCGREIIVEDNRAHFVVKIPVL